MAVSQEDPATPSLTDITLWSVAGGQPLRTFSSGQSILCDFTFSPSGDEIATTGSEVIHFLDTATGADARTPCSWPPPTSTA